MTFNELLTRNAYAIDAKPGYHDIYEKFFAPLQLLPITIMEIGVRKGGSLLLWRDYFARAQIVGVDYYPPEQPIDRTGRVQIFQSDQRDMKRMDEIARTAAPGGFDIIVDDAAHIGSAASASFKALFYKHLKPDGLYALEDWETGYWSTWDDGSRPIHASEEPFPCEGQEFPSHQSGMVGFVKQLVDEVGQGGIFNPNFSGNPGTPREDVWAVHVYGGLVIVEKSSQAKRDTQYLSLEERGYRPA